MLTEQEAIQAKAMGWQLCEVYCLSKERPLLLVLPTTPMHRNAEDAMNAVVWLAKNRDAVAIRALTLISQYNMTKGKK